MANRNHINRTKINLNSNRSNFSFGSLSKGLILLSAILSITFTLFFIVSTVISFNTSEESVWEDAFVGQIVDFYWVVPVLVVLIFFWIIFYLLYLQLVKLSEFAYEVESGEFEEKILEELDG